MNATTARIESGLEEVSATVGGFRAKLIEGELVDLTGIDTKVIDLCAGIAELPPSERAGFEGQLAVLLKDLKQISSFLSEQSAAVDAEMQRRAAEDDSQG
jgi:hypothetical protein